MQNKKLSIIIPHYNSADLLDKLLSTIPDKDAIQVIVVDDHSDKLVEELEECKKKYSNRNIEFYVNESCIKGAGSARNTGLKYAKGEWLMFADADDYFLPNMYDKVAVYFESEYDIVYFTPISIDLQSGKISDRHIPAQNCINRYLKKKTLKNELELKYSIVAPWSKLVRAKLFSEHNIVFDEVMVANDVMCSIKLAFYAKNIFVTTQTIYCATKQEGTLTTFITEKRFDERMEVYYRRHQYLKEHLTRREYKLLRFGARVRLRQVKSYKFGIRKEVKVLCDMIKNGIPIWREFSPLYYYDVVCCIADDWKAKH